MVAIAKETLIGKRIPKLDAPDKVAGRTRYIHDLDLPGQLYGRVLRTDRPHARIKRIDTSKAKALKGVHAVITAEDTPRIPLGIGRDNPPLKLDKVRCIRDEIAAVAAESVAVADAALKLIEVEYEDLPVLASPEEALKEGAPVVQESHPDNIARTFDYEHGDVAKGEAESDLVYEDTFHLHYVTHCCMGVSGMIADFDEAGNLTVYSNTQVPFLFKKDMADVTGLDPARIRVIQPPVGGGFGSKLDIYPFEPICIFLAKATGRPVKMTFTREEEFVGSPTRQPVVLTLRSGVTRDGRLTFREVRTLHDNGGYTSWGATTPFVIMQTISSLYRVPNCRYHTDVVYTNNPYAGSFRGYGNLQATFAVETHMDRMAEALGLDPLAFRLQNAHDPGDVTPQGMHFKSCGMKDCLQKAADASDFVAKHARHAAAREGAGRVKRGIGMASMLHVGGGAKIHKTDGCGTILKIDDFGHITIMTGASEIGQGSETVLAQLVCEELGLPLSAVTVINNDTEITPWDVGVHASRTTFIAGNSAIRAARKARDKILAAASRSFGNGIPAEEMDLRGGYVVRDADGEPIVEIGKLIRSLHFGEKNDLVMTTEYYEPPSVMQDRHFKGDVSAAYAWAAQVAEVAVDLDTGIVRVERVTSAHDVGRVINRLGIEGQVEGGVVMGVGYAITENLQVENGRVLNPNFRDYKLVTAPEIPEMDLIFLETFDGEGPQGAKGIGEAPAIATAPAIANAIYNATGVRITALPFSPERVYRALREAEGPA